MSDSDSDFSDELLALAGEGEKKRRRTSPKNNAKRRKAKVQENSDSEQEYESEEDDSNPFPLEEKYVDEADRERLMRLPEVERENILAQRLEEMQRIQDKRNLDQMLRAQRGDAESVSKAAKRAHQARGATKEKTQKLDELKAKRKAKSEKKRVKPSSPKRERDGSSSPVDMEMSSEDEEDGQISKLEQQEEKDARFLKQAKAEEEVVTLEGLEKCRLARSVLTQYAFYPWFEEYVKGSWVRFLIGHDKGPVYRICEVTSLGPSATKPYIIDDLHYDMMLELKHGSSSKIFPMEKVSNAPFTEDEWRRFKASCEHDKVSLPTKRAIEKKVQQNTKLLEQTATNAIINAMIEHKRRLNPVGPGSRSSVTKTMLERSNLTQMLTLAHMRRDFAEVAQINAQIAALGEAEAKLQLQQHRVATPVQEDILAKVNERNRQVNREAVRRLEAAEVERKRERWAAARAAANGSRAGTPAGATKADTPNSTPKLTASLSLGEKLDVSHPASPLPLGKIGSPSEKRSVESIVANAVEIDLGDF